MKKSKKKYVGEGTKFFIDFLPDDIFNSFSEEERLSYREYRRYQRFCGEGGLRIKKYQLEIEKLTQKINEERKKIKGIMDEDGWEKKMEFFYNDVSHLDKNLKLNVSIEKRNRTSKSKKVTAQTNLLPAGIYTVRVMFTNGKTSERKLVVRP
jgi:hypothetical protein